MRTAITNCNLIDGVSDEAIADVTVVLEGQRIVGVEAGSGGGTSADRVIDCGGGWLLPGLWDVHAHMGFPGPVPEEIRDRVVYYGHNAMKALRSYGVTGLRTVGTDNWIDVAWRDAFAKGQFVGPRIFAGGHFLTTTGGHGLRWPFSKECDGAVGFARAIREEIKHGVDQVKLNLSGGVMGPDWDRHWHSFLLPEELDAAFRLCRQREVKVVSHAANAQSVKDALRLGTWTLEHGYIMDDECIQMLLEKDTIYVPTLGITHLSPSQATNDWEGRYVEFRNIAPEFLSRADAASPEHKHWFQTALKAGVRMAVGSDLGPLGEGTLLEMGLWVRDGATPMQAIKAATKGAAEACCQGAVLGTVEEGKIADLIVVGENPLEDINNLRELRMVFKEGKLVEEK